MIAWVWLASSLTRDPFLVALVPAALKWPLFLLALPSGLIADRYDRLRIIRLMDGGRALVLVALTAVIWTTEIPSTPPQSGLATPGLYIALIIAATLVGSAEVFRATAARSFLPQITRSADLEEANSKLSGTELVGHSMFGPALGAFMIAAHTALPFAFNAIAYGMAALSLRSVKAHTKASTPRIASWRAELCEAWQFLRAMPNLLYLAAITAFWGFFIEMTMVALVLFSRENLGATSEIYGMIIAGSAVGGIAGAVWGPKLVRACGAARLGQATIAGSAACILMCTFVDVAIWLVVPLTALQFCFLIWNIISIAYRQRTIPMPMMGRVNSIYNLFGWLMAPIGIAMAGIIANRSADYVSRETALTMPFFVASIGCLLIAVFFWRRLALIFTPHATAHSHD